MQYYSLNRESENVNFRKAVFQGLAPDRGLYFPESIPKIRTAFFEQIENLSHAEIAFEVISPFVGDEIPETDLKRIITETLSFDFPITEIEPDIYALELFHGPTMAFKDVGARFMARCLGFFNQHDPNAKHTVLVATSGDTGGAVASGFLDVEGVDVAILYPKGKVSDIQERQLTTLGRNIKALRVDGVFDDCQDMVKTAFLDSELASLNLTSANSINIARWLPQMFYFFFVYKSLRKTGKPITISCPSGNFGNICAGILAKKMGLPIAHFVASTNANDTVPRFLQQWQYDPKASVQTLSNAMDVGNPSNFSRILELYAHDKSSLLKDFSAYSFSDGQTVAAMKSVYGSSGYLLDPHGAVGYLGLRTSMDRTNEMTGVFLETAHSVKFGDVVNQAIGMEPEIPEQLKSILDKKIEFTDIRDYEELKLFLLNKR